MSPAGNSAPREHNVNISAAFAAQRGSTAARMPKAAGVNTAAAAAPVVFDDVNTTPISLHCRQYKRVARECQKIFFSKLHARFLLLMDSALM
jgi:hypothetical protein